MGAIIKAASCAAVYVRRSHRDAGGSDEATRRAGKSLREQEADCRALAKRLGLEVLEVYAEKEGTGASDLSKKPRPVWEAALAALDAGTEFRTLIVWDLDRADRRGWAALAPLFKSHSGGGDRRIVDTHGLDTSNPDGKWNVLIRSEMAAEEAVKTGQRVRRAKSGQREAGSWLGGRPPYGLRVVTGKVEPDPMTYPTARRIAESLLSGGTLWGIARELNSEGLRTLRGAEWTPATLGLMVRSPAWAGLQSIRPITANGKPQGFADVYLDESGRSVSIGSGVITPDERARILAALKTRTNAASATNGAARGSRLSRTLLGRLGRCSLCGGTVSVTGSAKSLAYRCTAASHAKGCPGFAARCAQVDDAVSAAFITRISALEAGSLLQWAIAEAWTEANDPALIDEREAATARKAEAVEALTRVDDAFADGVLDGDAYRRQRERLTARLSDAEERLANLKPSEPDFGALEDAALLAEAWHANTDEERRGLLSLAISEVRIAPARARGSKEGITGRLVIVWKDGVITE